MAQRKNASTSTKGLCARCPVSSHLPKDRYEWVNAVIGEDGPRSHTTRLVLLTLSVHMDKQGMCFPSYETLAKESGLSLRAVKYHMNLAHDEEWFKRTSCMGHAKGWRRYDYEAMMPVFGGECAAPRIEESMTDEQRDALDKICK